MVEPVSTQDCVILEAPILTLPSCWVAWVGALWVQGMVVVLQAAGVRGEGLE